MDKIIFRVAILILVFSIAITAIALIIGSLVPSTIAIGYHENEGEIYVVDIREMSRDYRLQLAGTRCFKPLPPWVYTDEVSEQAAPDTGRSFVRRATVNDVIVLLSCR